MTSPLPSHELRVAIDAVKIGAQKALSFYDRGIAHDFKSDNSVITEADPATEEVIKNVILKSFPNANFVAEESGGSIDQDEFWIIDPIDGTRSFSRGIPTWNILISYFKNKEVCLGVSYFPLFDILIYAEKDKGAFANDKQIHVSTTSSLEKSLLGTGSTRRFKDKQIVLDLIETCSSLRTYDLAFSNMLIAKGSLDGLIDAYGATWDLAPYKVIIEEAGGKMTRLDGSEWKVDGQVGAIVSNGILHDALVSLVDGRK